MQWPSDRGQTMQWPSDKGQTMQWRNEGNKAIKNFVQFPLMCLNNIYYN
jgi:hypothetical protein